VGLFQGRQGESPENGSFLGFGWRLLGIFDFERRSPETIGDEKMRDPAQVLAYVHDAQIEST
jgi:hypothetical protein